MYKGAITHFDKLKVDLGTYDRLTGHYIKDIHYLKDLGNETEIREAIGKAVDAYMVNGKERYATALTLYLESGSLSEVGDRLQITNARAGEIIRNTAYDICNFLKCNTDYDDIKNLMLPNGFDRVIYHYKTISALKNDFDNVTKISSIGIKKKIELEAHIEAYESGKISDYKYVQSLIIRKNKEFELKNKEDEYAVLAKKLADLKGEINLIKKELKEDK